MSTKIRPEHLARPALVYIRQSTLLQVHEHRESTERQYALVELAKTLGWDAAQVEVIDEDLGQSGASATQRKGFQRLTAEVSLGKVGAVLSLEVSRLARSSADWHRLLDLCALADTLIIDDDGVYDANDFNDRLVLGMKGTMSDAERHSMHLRLRGGILHKAKKGELVFPPPTGYVFENGALVFDPDEQVQKAIRLLFERFRLEGSVSGTVRYFARNKLLFPSRHAHRGAPAEIRWHVLDVPHALSILRNPVYAGAYAWGRNRERRVLVGGVVRRKQEKLEAREQWHAFFRDAHPGYITWEEHLENLKRIEENAVRSGYVHGRGAPRNGQALLQGLVLCGKCGRRMSPLYPVAHSPSYQCSRHNYGEGNCWSTVARRIDDKVVETLLAAFAPPELDLSLAVLKEVERQAADVDRQWKLRLERARYEAQRAERQYNAVEPENRVVARTLETRWNQKLQELAQVEHEYEQARSTHKLELSDEDKKKILALARDLPGLWNAPTTTNSDKKRILRLLIQEVVLSPVEVPKRAIRIRILWKTGAITELLVPRPTMHEARRTPPQVIAEIRRLARQHYSDTQIAEDLNRRGFKSGLRQAFNTRLVAVLRTRRGIAAGRRPGGCNTRMPERDEQGLYSTRGLVVHFGVTVAMVHHWVRRGLVTPVHSRTPMPKRGTEPFWFEMTPQLEALLAKARAQGYEPGNPPPGLHPSGRPRPPARLPDGRYSTRGLVEKYGVTWNTVRYWIRRGILTPERALPGGSFCFRLTPAVERRIQATLARERRSRGSKQHHRRHIHSH
ncbi:MAG TPA: recombinase family protein [Archangium sp.]|uniref:recombinase family protein n=1 Tax=Archangium sp. TaxID=1872627 RepID=UPI002E2F6F6B|nr:recombinase family protein [Archangium sp.]HEX5754189.1 recombinase family protein [Archangium sp.]